MPTSWFWNILSWISITFLTRRFSQTSLNYHRKICHLSLFSLLKQQTLTMSLNFINYFFIASFFGSLILLLNFLRNSMNSVTFTNIFIPEKYSKHPLVLKNVFVSKKYVKYYYIVALFVSWPTTILAILVYFYDDHELSQKVAKYFDLICGDERTVKSK